MILFLFLIILDSPIQQLRITVNSLEMSDEFVGVLKIVERDENIGRHDVSY